MLLILDNCEHVLEPVAAIAHAITRNCPDVRLLATSRQALGMIAVRRYCGLPHSMCRIRSPTSRRQRLSSLGRWRSLSIERGSWTSRFVLTDDTAPNVADICRRLDGIPLAIELAAARVKILRIPSLAQRLNERFNHPHRR